MSGKIVVPDGMLTAAMQAIGIPEQYKQTHQVNKALEAALRWLSENPIVPTLDKFGPMQIDMRRSGLECTPWNVAIEWQRRMFLAPEETLPSELIDIIHGKNEWSPADILEAYRRGQKAPK